MKTVRISSTPMRLPFRHNNNLRNERGAAAVEFALIAAVLFVFVFGIIEFGRLFSELEVLTSAAREGARAAAVRGTSEDVEEAVADAAVPYELDAAPNVDKTCDDTTSGQAVTVSWDQNFEFSVGLLPAFNRDIEVRGVFRCE